MSEETTTQAPDTFEEDTWLYSKKFKDGKLFRAGEQVPDAKEGFVDSPEKL